MGVLEQFTDILRFDRSDRFFPFAYMAFDGMYCHLAILEILFVFIGKQVYDLLFFIHSHLFEHVKMAFGLTDSDRGVVKEKVPDSFVESLVLLALCCCSLCVRHCLVYFIVQRLM